jgi:hypothetical protein
MAGASVWASLHSLGLSSNQDEAIEPQFEVGRERGEVGAFGFPIDAVGGEILQAEGHFGVRAESLEDVLFLPHMVSSMPSRRRAAMNFWSARRGGSSATPRGPSSPQMPRQRVSSQSSAITLKGE